MSTKPPLPALFIVPGSEQDFHTLYSIAVAYAHSGQLLNERAAARPEQVAFAFPAMVCSSFAIELFLKFFITLDNSDNPALPPEPRRGHYLVKLWERVKPVHQDLIAGMYRNPSHTPRTAGIDICKTIFLEALNEIGPQPFVEWRYAYEIDQPVMMSQGAVAEVLEAIGYVAEHIMGERRALAGV